MSVVLIANTDFFKKPAGILKICQLVLGMIVMSLYAHYLPLWPDSYAYKSHTFMLITSCTFFIGNILIIISSVFSVNTEIRLRQSLFEPLYHFLALVLYFSGSVAVLASPVVNLGGRNDAFMAAGGLGIVTSLLYGVSTFDSYKGYVTE